MRKLSHLSTPLAGLLLLLAGLGLVLSTVSCSDTSPNDSDDSAATPVAIPRDAGYIGATACAQCHEQEHDDWVGSHHDLAMKEPTEDTVLGDFDDATFTHFGVTSRFFKQNGKYFVHTDGPDGEMADFEIAYTFGWDPLQQYLVRFPGGKVQALTICWDTRPEEEGGQRWYHLYPDEPTPAGDALHWAGPNFRWNHMCAECHSTDVQKNYDPQTKTFKTTWEAINVSCEACHGPGQAHAEWAELYEAGKADKDGDMGLAVLLKDETRVWVMNPETGIAERQTPLKDDTLLNACARCHARRSQISHNRDAGVPFLDNYRPAHLTETLYFPDGQIQDEVYVWGSFVQSKMHMKGVTCMDCHDPHTARVPTTTNNLCAGCHQPSKFDTPEHHFHEAGSAGASCIDCHMPHRTYMGIDDRRDHSFRIPRPDLSVKLGTPNACNQCHTDRDAQWAADAAAQWWGVDLDRPEHFGEVFADARTGAPDADARLLAVLRDAEQPPIVRGTAVMLLARYPTRRAAEGVVEALASDEPMIRVAAADMLGTMPLDRRIKPALGLLNDPLRAIRIEAGEALVDVPAEQISDADRAKVRAGIDAYQRAQRVSEDTAAAQMNLASVAYRMGDIDRARQMYEGVVETDPTFFPAYANLASIYTDQGDPAKALSLLDDALRLLPDNPDLIYARALVHIRTRNIPAALRSFGRAYALAPDRPDLAYAYALALHDTGNPTRAVAILKQALASAPHDVGILIALAQYNAELLQFEDALTYAKRAQRLLPDDPGIAQFVRQLEAQQR